MWILRTHQCDHEGRFTAQKQWNVKNDLPIPGSLAQWLRTTNTWTQQFLGLGIVGLAFVAGWLTDIFIRTILVFLVTSQYQTWPGPDHRWSRVVCLTTVTRAVDKKKTFWICLCSVRRRTWTVYCLRQGLCILDDKSGGFGVSYWPNGSNCRTTFVRRSRAWLLGSKWLKGLASAETAKPGEFASFFPDIYPDQVGCPLPFWTAAFCWVRWPILIKKPLSWRCLVEKDNWSNCLPKVRFKVTSRWSKNM